MPPTASFEMKIAEIFHFSDGRTVFVGTVDNEVPFIGPSICELLIDGIPTATITIEGEMIPDQRNEAGYRSLSTKSSVELDRDLLKKADCRLRPSGP